MRHFLEKASELTGAGVEHVIVTLVDARGEAPADCGAKAIVTESGLVEGTVGGGKIEARTIVVAKELLVDRVTKPLLKTWNLQKDIGMTCGGEVTYLFEPYYPSDWKIAVFGAGHVSQALVRSLLPLDCGITCIDARREWVEKLPVSPKLKAVTAEVPAEWVKRFDANTFFVVMTQGHATDVPILKEIFERNFHERYVGAIGSAVKAMRLKGDLKSAGISEGKLERLRCPIGLDIGGNSPAEIAVSITAQLLQERATRIAPTHASAAPTILLPEGKMPST